MDEVKVDVVKPEGLQRTVENTQGGVVAPVGIPEFGGDEQFLARNSALPYRLPYFGLVAVESCCIYMPPAALQRAKHRGAGIFRRHLIGAEAHIGYHYPVGKNHICCCLRRQFRTGSKNAMTAEPSQNQLA